MRYVVFFATFALAVAGAKSGYDVTFFQPSIVAGTELKPGDYKVEVDGDKATITHGKNTVQAAVKVENGDEKYPKTLIRYNNADGKYHLTEIKLGGTHTKLVFDN